MRFLLFAVTVALAYADHHIDYSQVSGDWYSLSIAADNVDKIQENGELRVHLSHLECIEECKKLSVRFYVKENGECKEFTVVGKQREDGVYVSDYSGKNYFKIVGQNDDLIAFSNVNVDEKDRKTRMMLLAGRRNFLTEEEKQRFAALVEERGIPLENIQPITETDPCPE